MHGKLFTIKGNSKFGIGGTYQVSSTVNEERLKKVIEENHAVMVRLLNKDNEELTTGYITNYKKDLTANSANDPK